MDIKARESALAEKTIAYSELREARARLEDTAAAEAEQCGQRAEIRALEAVLLRSGYQASRLAVHWFARWWDGTARLQHTRAFAAWMQREGGLVELTDEDVYRLHAGGGSAAPQHLVRRPEGESRAPAADVAPCASFSPGVRGACRLCGLPAEHANHTVVPDPDDYLRLALADRRYPVGGSDSEDPLDDFLGDSGDDCEVEMRQEGGGEGCLHCLRPLHAELRRRHSVGSPSGYECQIMTRGLCTHCGAFACSPARFSHEHARLDDGVVDDAAPVPHTTTHQTSRSTARDKAEHSRVERSTTPLLSRVAVLCGAGRRVVAVHERRTRSGGCCSLVHRNLDRRDDRVHLPVVDAKDGCRRQVDSACCGVCLSHEPVSAGAADHVVAVGLNCGQDTMNQRTSPSTQLLWLDSLGVAFLPQM